MLVYKLISLSIPFEELLIKNLTLKKQTYVKASFITMSTVPIGAFF